MVVSMLSMASVGHPAAVLFRLVERLGPRPAHGRASPGMATKSIDDTAVMIWVTRKEIRYVHYPTAKGCCGIRPSKRARLARSSRADSAYSRRVSHRSLEAELSSSRWHKQCGTERARGHGRRRALLTACRDDWRRRVWVCIHVAGYL